MVLVGPSGSGKTTALRMLAGLEPLDGGRIEIGGRDISDVQPKDRDIAMVFQNYALYPSKTVAENMGFALKMQHVPKAERDRRVKRGGPHPRPGRRPARPQAQGSCPAASGSASPWAGPSSASRRSS